METDVKYRFMNEFLVGYFRLCHIYAIQDWNVMCQLKKELLVSCIYLQNCDQSQDVVKFCKEKLEEKILEYAVVEDDPSMYHVKRCFPSLVDGKASFFDYSRLVWIDQFELNRDEQDLFENIIIPIVVYYYTDQTDEATIRTVKKWLKEECGIDTEHSSVDWGKAIQEIKCRKDTIYGHYQNLYLGRGTYATQKEIKSMLRTVEAAIVDFVNRELKEKCKDMKGE